MTDWEKRARELWPAGGHVPVRQMLQLGREMADARAEEIARSKPKTREQVLEEALRSMDGVFIPDDSGERAEAILILKECARRALAWRPPP